MSVEILKEEINHINERRGQVVSYISECDIIVPDYKPDIVNILEVTAWEQIEEKNVSKDYVTVSGTVNYNILYVGDDSENSVNNIRYKTPFTNQIPIDGTEQECNCIVNSEVVHTQYNVHNSRKFNVKCAVEMSADIYVKVQGEIVSGVSDQTRLPCKINNTQCYNVCTVNEHIFNIEEMCSIGENSHCSEVVKQHICVKNSEIKIVANKAIIKGDVSVKVLYLEDGLLKETQSEIPFTQIIDIDITQTDIIPTAEYVVKNATVTCELDDDATMSKLNVNAQLCAVIKLFAQSSMGYVSDAYSPDFQTDIIRSEIVVTGMEDTVTSQCIVNDYLKIENGCSIENVLAFDTSAHIEKSELSSDGIKVNGFVNASAIYKGDNGNIYSAYSQLPFGCDIAVNPQIISKCNACVCHISDYNSSYNIDGADRINVREVIKLCCNLISENHADVINDIQFDEKVKTDKSNQAGITVYFVQNGDTMWDIAKRYHTTGDEIITVNKLDGDFQLTAGQQLLIPKHN